ncbi:MAG: DUF1343 domain-containing protein [Saprospiraceae bacterium]
MWQLSCQQPHSSAATTPAIPEVVVAPPILTGAAQLSEYLPLLQGKGVGLVVNPTSTIGTTHLVDTLLTHQIDIKAIFAPEHGFRGTADAGEHVANGRDTRTGLPIISLYGSHREPTRSDLQGVDVLVFDIQDVGARFYTYISTLHYVMQAAALHQLPVIVLDRPNPNGHYVDGPVLNPAFRSFVGMHPVPVVHGMTVGEYARMINGEGWLEGGRQATLTVVPCLHYTHDTTYELPIPPSPNLSKMEAIYLYPSTCFFEGTTFSEGRGTPTPFQVFGHPDFSEGGYTFTPVSGAGAKHPKWENQLCQGVSLTHLTPEAARAMGRINLSWLLDAYTRFDNKKEFFLPNHFIDKLAGTDQLRLHIQEGWSEDRIRSTWQADLDVYKVIREKYLLYN